MYLGFSIDPVRDGISLGRNSLAGCLTHPDGHRVTAGFVDGDSCAALALRLQMPRSNNDIAVPSFIVSGAPIGMYIPKSCGAPSGSGPFQTLPVHAHQRALRRYNMCDFCYGAFLGP